MHEYLDNASIAMASDKAFNTKKGRRRCLQEDFHLNHEGKGLDPNAFKRWDGNKFTGHSSLAAYEVIALWGVTSSLPAILQLNGDGKCQFIAEKARELWSNQTFRDNSGSGVRGTTRLAHLLPLAEDYFKP